MKKILAMLLALVMVAAAFTGCVAEKDTKETTKATEATDDTTLQEPSEGDVEVTEPVGGNEEQLTGLDATITAITEKSPVEFMAGIIPVDVTDTTEDGLWAIKSFTGLASAEKLTAAVAYESMMGSQAFSLVLVQVKDAADAQAVAQEMKDNIDMRKWVCVGADEIAVVGSGDVIMLIMVDSANLGLKTESFVTAFTEVMGGQVDFTI